MTRVERAGLDVAAEIVEFVEAEALPGSGIDADTLWQGLAGILHDLTPANEALLAERDRLQTAIDDYHREHPGQPEPQDYRAFLTSLGYLRDAPADVAISTGRVDPEIATLAGPQLVVPLLNARFAINAANARWGSLYDALYGTDALDDADGAGRTGGYDPVRGARVIAAGRAVLDDIAPLVHGSHADATAYTVADGELVIALTDGGRTGLAEPSGFAGFRGDPGRPTHILLTHHGLHAEIVIDPSGAIGGTDRAGVQDVVLEAALTTIMDLEDSVAAVDAEDKALGYRNWRGLMTGALTAELDKGGRTITRRMAPDRSYTAPDGSELTLPGRSLLLIRNVGHLMRTDAVRTADGRDVPEGILDAVMTTLGSLPDLRGPEAGRNSRAGSMYIVKPKMHGPDEVAFTATLFGRVEDLLGLPPRTLKIGIMDEERRTTLNLAAAIDAASDRVVFANTGFLDRTGDEIHTSFWAGPMRPKSEMKAQRFMQAYERANVATSLAAGFGGRAQIGKGMWAMPDLMADMLEQKIGHVEAGATTAWVPSPTAATLHALHYHRLDPFTRHADILRSGAVPLDDILVPPLADGSLDADEVQAEVDNSAQTILGYVVRWIDQGVGCSKVPDIRGVGLMEDRATLRISSQLLANWLAHGVITEAQLDDSLARLAVVVDGQNAGDPLYEPLRPAGVPGIAFQAARRIVVEGAAQPSGYTEPILHEMRRRKKQS